MLGEKTSCFLLSFSPIHILDHVQIIIRKKCTWTTYEMATRWDDTMMDSERLNGNIVNSVDPFGVDDWVKG